LARLRSEDRSDPTERRGGHGPSRRRATARPRLEVLEERRVLSTLTVTSNSDYPWAGTLRNEIAVAQPGDTIVFDPSLDGQTITLALGELEINKNLTIQGPGAGLLAINGNSNEHAGSIVSRGFQVDTGANVTISGLTIEGGNGMKIIDYHNTFDFTPDYYDGRGGGILNLGTLALSGCNVTGNSAGSDLGASYRFEGGGIYNNGTMTLSGCTVTGNTARDLVYSSGYVVKGAGGGIFNDAQGRLTILSSVVSNNTASDGADICNLGSITISKDSSIGSKVSRR
jgi:hypothetical protein